MKLRTATVTIVALILGFLLIGSGPLVTPWTYQIGFFLGLLTFVVLWLLPGGQIFVRIGQAAQKRAVMWPLVVLAVMAPYIVLVEAGIAGYRGFVSPMRYASIVIATLGAALLMFGFVMPFLLRRRTRR